MKLDTLIAEPWADYGLVDSGHGRKLERYGPYRFIRPEPQALWAPASPDWRADGEFVPGSDEDGGGRWQFAQPVPHEGCPLHWDEVTFTAQTTPFRHLGFFPDMAPVWGWMRECVADKAASECLNLFGYTGVGTLAMAAKGVKMVDAPVSGGVAAAEAGTLTFMVGGSEAAFAAAKPYLEKMGKNIVHAGPAGNGQVAKTCNNMLLGISMIGVSEAFKLGESLGLDPKTLFEISSKATGQCWSMTSYCPVPGLVPTAPSNQ